MVFIVSFEHTEDWPFIVYSFFNCQKILRNTRNMLNISSDEWIEANAKNANLRKSHDDENELNEIHFEVAETRD